MENKYKNYPMRDLKFLLRRKQIRINTNKKEMRLIKKEMRLIEEVLSGRKKRIDKRRLG